MKQPRKKVIIGVPSRGFLSEKSIFMDGLGERVFTLLSSVNHFYWTFFQASSGQGAYTRTHFESDPSSSRQRDSHCGKRGQSKGKRGEWRQPARKQVLLSHVRPVWLIHLRLFNQGSRVNGLWRKMTSILRYWVGQYKKARRPKRRAKTEEMSSS